MTSSSKPQKSNLEKIPEYKLVILGAGGVGKSALTIRLISDNFLEEYDPTIEDSYRKTIEINNKPATIDVLDTAGQEEFAAMRDQWIRESYGFILVYSITSITSFDESKRLFRKILRIKEEELNEISIILCGNKCDLDNQRQVFNCNVQKLVKEWKEQNINCDFYETSAKQRINCNQIFHKCVLLIQEAKEKKLQSKENKSKKKRYSLFSSSNKKVKKNEFTQQQIAEEMPNNCCVIM